MVGANEKYLSNIVKIGYIQHWVTITYMLPAYISIINVSLVRYSHHLASTLQPSYCLYSTTIISPLLCNHQRYLALPQKALLYTHSMFLAVYIVGFYGLVL